MSDGPINILDQIIVPMIDWIHEFFPETPVIVERTNVARPTEDYFSINTTAPLQQAGLNDSTKLIVDENGDPVAGDKEGHFKYMVCGQRIFTLSLKAYIVKDANCDRPAAIFDAQEMLARLRDAISTDFEREILVEAGLSVFVRNDILDLTDLIEAGYEARAGMDLVMGIASNREVEIPAIAKTVIGGTVEQSNEEVEIDFES